MCSNMHKSFDNCKEDFRKLQSIIVAKIIKRLANKKKLIDNVLLSINQIYNYDNYR